ncbi:MAG: amidohydrolase family protein [Spirochaetia bacterium]|jgi:hypothetical protein
MDSAIAEWNASFLEDIKKLRFFDANCWCGMSKYPRRALVKTIGDLDVLMERTGVEKGNVSSFIAKFLKPMEGNAQLLEDVSGKSRYTPCIVATPWMFPTAAQVEAYVLEMVSRGARSVRLFPKTHHYIINDWSNGFLLKLLEHHRIPLFVTTKDWDWHTLYELSHAHPVLPVVLEQSDTEAFFNLGYLMPFMERCPNVYLETNRVHEYLALDTLVRRFGGGRFVYGSSLPLDDPYAHLAMITMGDFSQANKEQIAHGNLEKLFAGVRN